MSAESWGWGPVLTTVSRAIEDEVREDSIRAVTEGERSGSWMRYRSDAVRRSRTEEMARSIAGGGTSVFRRTEDGRLQQISEGDLGPLMAWLEGVRGKLVRKTSYGRRGEVSQSEVFEPQNDQWTQFLVETPIDWAVVRSGKTAGRDELGAKSRRSHLIVIAALLQRAGRLVELDDAQWTSQVQGDIDRAGLQLSENTVRDILKAAKAELKQFNAPLTSSSG